MLWLPALTVRLVRRQVHDPRVVEDDALHEILGQVRWKVTVAVLGALRSEK